MNKEIIEEFRNKFGGDAWLGADRELVEYFILKTIHQQKEEFKKVVEELSNIEVETKRGNLETKVEIKAKLTKSILKAIEKLTH